VKTDACVNTGREKSCSGLAYTRPLLLLAVLTLTACKEETPIAAPPPVKAAVAKPVKQSVTRYIEATGNTQPINTVDLQARVQGFLDSINYVDGALVKKGTVLFELQRDTYEAQVQEAKATLASQQAAQANARIEYSRQSTLGKDQFSPQSKVDDTKTRLDQLTADVDGAKADLEQAQINLGYTTMTAPYDGIVTRHLVDVGALVGYAGPTKLATIVQVDPLHVYFNVSETVILRLQEELAKRGKTLREVGDLPVEIGLQTEDGYPHKGKLDYVSPQLDTSTGTIELRARVMNTDFALLPGLFVRVRIPIEQIDNALLVSDTAIGSNQSGDYVLVAGKDNVVEQRRIRVGLQSGQFRVVESGLTAEDWVLTSDMQRAAPGTRIDPEQTVITADAAD
jgi:multidrug efflux system membrane fusion protein